MRIAAFAIGLLGLVASSPAAAADLAPAGEWQVRQDDEYCELSRQFGTGSQAVTMYVYSYGPVGLRRVSLVGEQIPRNDNAAAFVDARFDGVGTAYPLTAIVSRRGDQGMVTFQTSVEGQRNYAFMKGRWPVTASSSVIMTNGATSLSVDAERMEPLTLDLGNMSEPIAQLQDCSFSLAEDWGYPADEERQVAERATISNPNEVWDRISYPNVRRVNRTSTILQLRMRVTAQGELEDCVVQSPSWGERFARDTCEAIERYARFEPALNANGEAVSSLMRFSNLMVIFD